VYFFTMYILTGINKFKVQLFCYPYISLSLKKKNRISIRKKRNLIFIIVITIYT